MVGGSLKQHLAGKRLATGSNMKQAVPPAYRHLPLVPSLLGHNRCHTETHTSRTQL